jgi:oligopeptide transport system permease protein
MASLVIVAGLRAADRCWRRLGLVASHWQDEVGVPNAPPTFVGPRASRPPCIELPKGPNVDLSDIDPLAPRYKEWAERAKQFADQETVKAETLPFGADRLGRDVLAKAVKGTEISVFVGVMAALVATLIGTLLGAWAASSAARWATSWSGSTTSSSPSPTSC